MPVSSVEPNDIKIRDNMMSRVAAAEEARSEGLYAEEGYNPTSICPRAGLRAGLPHEIKVSAFYIGPKKGMYNRLLAQVHKEIPAELRSRVKKAKMIFLFSIVGLTISGILPLIGIPGIVSCAAEHKVGNCNTGIGLMISGSVLCVINSIGLIYSSFLTSQENTKLLQLIRTAENEILPIAMKNAKQHIQEMNT